MGFWKAQMSEWSKPIAKFCMTLFNTCSQCSEIVLTILLNIKSPFSDWFRSLRHLSFSETHFFIKSHNMNAWKIDFGKKSRDLPSVMIDHFLFLSFQTLVGGKTTAARLHGGNAWRWTSLPRRNAKTASRRINAHFADGRARQRRLRQTHDGQMRRLTHDGWGKARAAKERRRRWCDIGGRRRRWGEARKRHISF